jgi:hypothetical protein
MFGLTSFLALAFAKRVTLSEGKKDTIDTAFLLVWKPVWSKHEHFT